MVILDELSSSVISKSLEWNELHLKKMEKSFDVKSREAVMEGIFFTFTTDDKKIYTMRNRSIKDIARNIIPHNELVQSEN